MSPTDLFDVIERLVGALPWTPERVGAILGAPLVRNPAADTATVEAWGLPSAAAAGAFETIDLRMPDPDLGGDGFFLSVTPRDAGGADRASAVSRFGPAFRNEVPSPRYPAGAVPAYLVYEHGWGRLAIGVANDEAGALVRFVIEGPAAAPRAAG
jgi:hypothetical protein